MGGRRLPSDAEWVKAAVCPNSSLGQDTIPKIFPWGDNFEPQRANVWISGIGCPVSAAGTQASRAKDEIVQLIGNVWEWTNCDTKISSYGQDVRFELALKSLRGGAFDTYFENQATCQLQSGDSPLARRRMSDFAAQLSATDVIDFGGASMTHWMNVPLQSLDLAKYSVQVECYVCDGGNRFDAEFCRNCRAPLTLAYQAQKQKVTPQLLAVLGGPSVGKTCYVGMLTDMLSRQPSGLQMLAHGAFSVSLQQQTISALARRRFPPSTPISPEGWRWIHCDVRDPTRRRAAELVIPDISGTAITDELETPHRVPAIRQLMNKSAGAMILVETHSHQHDEHKPEFIAMKIVSELLRMPGWC